MGGLLAVSHKCFLDRGKLELRNRSYFKFFYVWIPIKVFIASRESYRDFLFWQLDLKRRKMSIETFNSLHSFICIK